MQSKLKEVERRRIERPLTIRFVGAPIPKGVASVKKKETTRSNKHVVKSTLKSLVFIWSIQEDNSSLVLHPRRLYGAFLK